MCSYRSPDKRSIGDSIDDGKSAGFLFLSLPAGVSDPAENDTIDGIRTDSEDDHGKISCSGVQCGASEHETEDCNRFGHGDVPCALILFAGVGRPEDGCEASDEIGWASEDEGDGLTEAKSLNGCREEIFETIGCKMHVLHKCEEPQFWIFGRFFQPSTSAGSLLAAHCITLNASMGQLPLLRAQPAG